MAAELSRTIISMKECQGLPLPDLVN